ncbi:hypothetical protein OG819_42585 [Streptomyces sp. NBC_01549]|uniref:hypothetical protein n=1 Tax=Streptomyces sp. NBC_01549 TaxID=2975874 RepID=UPI00225919B2|nr:hypothetical protein [Streptomyces sp. NBC_01549]MCX4596104.1 hypothetical protein [Streptomyces sp. NBC_01549]
MTAPFEAVGDLARWRTIYDALKPLNVDDVLTYEQAAEVLELNAVTDRSTIQAAVRRAARTFETVDKHALVAVPNVGYRVVRADEHVVLARGQQRRSSRALTRGHSKVVNIDLNGLSPEVRALTEATARALSLQMDFNRRFDVRQQRLESVVSEVSERTERSEAEIAELKARLARLEQAG